MLKAGLRLASAGVALGAAGAAIGAEETAVAKTRPPLAPSGGQAYRPVVTLNGGSLPWKLENGVKVFHLTAEPCEREFAPGMVATCWGYNGQTPGPTIEAVEGDRIRILVTNKLPEPTSIHWHGIYLPNGMDGVSGLTQPHIKPGQTFVYEFVLRQSGSYMYHPHADETVQMAMGMMGMFIIHPKDTSAHLAERDYCILLHNWDIEPGTKRPKSSTMTEFNLWSMNSRVFPGIDPMVAGIGERVRIRIANLSMHDHPMHIHGVSMTVTGTDGGWIRESAQWPETTVLVPVGSIRMVEFIADAPGDWPFHCHKAHHAMNAMGHSIPNLHGVDQTGLEERIRTLVPGYMAMGEAGMDDMAGMRMPLPGNTLPMMMGEGPFGPIGMGGMFTIIKVRDGLVPGDYRDPGWYRHPVGSVAYPLT
jgi:manganese oxidase